MVTGPVHYREAERLVTDIALDDKTYDVEVRDRAVARAQVHATLALAAATAMRGRHDGAMDQLDFEAWDEACGAQEDELDEDESIDAGEEWRLAERERHDWLAAEPSDGDRDFVEEDWQRAEAAREGEAEYAAEQQALAAAADYAASLEPGSEADL
jgi:hypothetical protein